MGRNEESLKGTGIRKYEEFSTQRGITWNEAKKLEKNRKRLKL